MSAAAKCLQVILAIFNLAFLIFGTVVLVFSVSYLTQSAPDSSAHATGVGLVTVGAASIVIGIFGCIGAFCRSRCLLIVYCICLVCLVIAQCVTGGLSIATSSDQKKISDFGLSVWTAMPDSSKVSFQDQYKCCGYYTPLDHRPAAGCGLNNFNGGCSTQMVELLQNAIFTSGVFLLVAAGCQIVAIVIALILVFDSSRRKAGYGYGW